MISLHLCTTSVGGTVGTVTMVFGTHSTDVNGTYVGNYVTGMITMLVYPGIGT